MAKTNLKPHGEYGRTHTVFSLLSSCSSPCVFSLHSLRFTLSAALHSLFWCALFTHSSRSGLETLRRHVKAVWHGNWLRFVIRDGRAKDGIARNLRLIWSCECASGDRTLLQWRTGKGKDAAPTRSLQSSSSLLSPLTTVVSYSNAYCEFCPSGSCTCTFPCCFVVSTCSFAGGLAFPFWG